MQLPKLVGLCSCLLMLTVSILAGCDSKSKGTAEGDSSNKAVAAKVDLPKPTPIEKTPSSTKGGKDAKAKEANDPVSRENGGRLAETATELTRLQHKAFVIFYKGFSEDQMKAYIDNIDKYYGMGKEPRRSYGIFSYQAELAKTNLGMRIVREDDFTRITIPVQKQFRKPKDDGAKRNFAALAIPVCHGLIKIDESVRGKISYATSNDDWSEIYIAGDKFGKQ